MKRISLCLLMLFIGLFTVEALSQNLADLARQERARQQAARSAVVLKAVGSADGANGGEAAPAKTEAAAAPAPAGKSSESKPKGLTDNKGRDEKFWRSAFQQAREDLKRAEAAVEVLDLRVKELNTQLLRQSDLYNRENRLGPEITAAQKELEDARQQVEQGKKKIADLEEELRRSGGPPGWAR